MWTSNTIELIGSGGRSIYNRLYMQGKPGHLLTVIVAGFAYTTESPYLFYSKQVPHLHGNDVLAVDFEYSRRGAFLQLSEPEREAWFQEEVGTLNRFLRQQATYQTLSFIGKSLGTTAVFQLLQDEEIHRKTARAAWLTPGEKRSEIAELLLHSPLPSLIVYGAKDRYALDVPVDRLRERSNVDLLLVPGADHALETTSPITSIEYLMRYVHRLEALYSIGETK
jgi:pimeloyl-ACP methyl ester carboxylesterase